VPSDRSTSGGERLQAAQQGDRSAIAALIEPEADRVYAVCLRMVGHPETARDLAQEALAKAIRGLPDFDGRSAFGTWITRIAMNTCLSWHRSRKRASRNPIASLHIDPVELDSTEHTPAWSVQWEERRRAVAVALEQLSPEHRAVLVLRDVRGLEYEQIGEVLDIAVGTVKSRLFRARASLREAVERHEAAGEITEEPSTTNHTRKAEGN